MANLPPTSGSAKRPSGLKGKRKKVIPASANPLFTKWITEWKDEAIEKGWKSQYNYSKALRTLKMFPLCLQTGKDCKMLQNFGDKMCKMLDEKLEEHKRNQDKGIAEDSPQHSSGMSSQPLVPELNQLSTNLSVSRTSTIHAISDNSDSGEEGTTSPQKKKKRKTSGTRSREYVPAYRSGPYALILSMYRHSLNPDYKGFMTKAELMHAAQPLADKSFTIPDPGSHYTAWSSMSTLTRKFLVVKVGNPAKYHLTQEGSDLGQRLENAEQGVDNPATFTATVCTDSGYDDSQKSCPVQPKPPPPLKQKPSASLEQLDHLNLSAEERAFILEGVTQDENPTLSTKSLKSNSTSHAYIIKYLPPIQNVLDNIPVYISDDEDSFHHAPEWRDAAGPSKLPRAHSLSPSNSPPSSPEAGKLKLKGLSRLESVDNNDNDFDKSDNAVNDSICIMGYDDDDDYNKNDDNDDIASVGDHSPPVRLRLPSLSPTPSYSHSESHRNPPSKARSGFDACGGPSYDVTEKRLSTNDSPYKLNDGVIEIDDDDDDVCDSKFTNVLSNKVSYDRVHTQLSQCSGSYEGHQKKKNIFNNFDELSSQNFQRDEDDDGDLPDLDLSVPLSKRLFNKGAVSSQLLSQFNTELKESFGDPVKSTGKTTQETLQTVRCSSHSKDIVILDDDDDGPKPSKSVAYLTSKPEPFENAPKMDAHRRVTKLPALVAETPNSCDPAGTESSVDSPPVPEFTFKPGSYDIVLCIDNREFYGSKSNSKTLLPDLMQHGVNCDLRLLHIGDILWVAREKGLPNEDPAKANRRELVLNFAIERKRMDDLVSSITGGRLKEQKFRLRHCGISELIILIEEYGSIRNFSLSEDRIKQSIVNSQILDGFKVKRCGSSKEAVMYLSMMTRFIQKYYGNKTLHAASHDYVKSKAPKSTIRDDKYYLMPFTVFNETSIKHKALTVKEMFGKQLIQIPGVSLERACAITKVYPSLVALMTAYKNCTSEKSKESLLSNIKCGNKERNLGIAVSRMVCMMYITKKLS